MTATSKVTPIVAGTIGGVIFLGLAGIIIRYAVVRRRDRVPEDSARASRKELTWSGEWNRSNIHKVIRELRCLFLHVPICSPFIATAAAPTPPSYPDPSVDTHTPPLRTTSFISFVASSFDGAIVDVSAPGTLSRGSMVSNSRRRVGKAARKWWMGDRWRRGTRLHRRTM
ncbi:hypothetical protein B0H14DRAFT_3870975 [Mycena olivaceomarginata]|nr:hypothetical protein B0H14DRAFT_3870975 [Mycena olivaceomarginata]